MTETTGPGAPRPPRRNHTAGFRTFEGEATIVLPDGSYIKVLNESGSRIWELLDGRRGLEEIASVIAAEYDVSPEEAGRDVREFVDLLASHGMLE